MSSPSEMRLMQRIDVDEFISFIVRDLHIYIQKALVCEGELSFRIAFTGSYCLTINHMNQQG